MPVPSRILLAGALALAFATAAAAEPAFTLSADGSTFIYKARPGDQPGTVAVMFGIETRDVPAFLTANGITDPTKVGIGHVYRIANPLATRASEAETKAAALEHEAAELRGRSDQLARDLDAARAAAEDAQGRATRLARFERLWGLMTVVGALLILAVGGLGWVAYTALQKTDVAERRAREVANELEEKRRTALAERQQAGRRELDLEAKVRDLELRLTTAPAPAIRRSPAGTG